MAKRGATEIRKGNVLDQDGGLWKVIDFDHNTPGNWRAIINIRVKNLSTGQSKTIRCGSSDNFEVAYLETRKCQYLYKDATTKSYVFMDQNDFEQYELSEDLVGDVMPFVVEEQVVDVTFYADDAVGIDIPGSVILTITESEPAAKGNSVNNIFKRAVCQTGLEIKVPLHIDVGETVKINTQTGEFLGRAKE